MVTVVFTQDVPNVGQKNNTKIVKLGYAKNWLIPQRLAVLATKSMLVQHELKKTALSEKREHLEKEFEAFSAQLASVALVFKPRKTSKGTLYAAIDGEKIAQGLKRKKIAVDPKYIQLEEPIKKVGEYAIPIVFSQALQTKLKVVVQ